MVRGERLVVVSNCMRNAASHLRVSRIFVFTQIHMARMYTQAEVDDLLQAERQRTEDRMEERFNAERVFLNHLIDMHTHKNAEYQKIITTMSTDIIKKNKQLGQADGEIVALRQVVGMLLGTQHAPAAPPMSCGMHASRTMHPF